MVFGIEGFTLLPCDNLALHALHVYTGHVLTSSSFKGKAWGKGTALIGASAGKAGQRRRTPSGF